MMMIFYADDTVAILKYIICLMPKNSERVYFVVIIQSILMVWYPNFAKPNLGFCQTMEPIFIYKYF